MALWVFVNDAEQVVAIRRDNRGSCEHGRHPARTRDDLVAIVLGRAGAWEQIATPKGLFTKQVSPRGWV